MRETAGGTPTGGVANKGPSLRRNPALVIKPGYETLLFPKSAYLTEWIRTGRNIVGLGYPPLKGDTRRSEYLTDWVSTCTEYPTD